MVFEAPLSKFLIPTPAFMKTFDDKPILESLSVTNTPYSMTFFGNRGSCHTLRFRLRTFHVIEKVPNLDNRFNIITRIEPIFFRFSSSKCGTH